MKFRKKFACGTAISLLLTFFAVTDSEAFVAAGRATVPASSLATTVSSEAGVSNEEAAGARNFIDSLGKRAIGFLSDASMSQQERKTEFRKLLEDSFDMNTVGRFALGTYWRVATPQQRDEYSKLFNDMIVHVYSRRFEDYEGQNFEVRSYRPEGKRDVLVTSHIVPQGDPEVRVDWLVRYKDGRYRIVDVIVEGVSMSITQRSDFSSIIQRGGGRVEVLLEHLRSQAGE